MLDKSLIREIVPDKAMYQPGEAANIAVTIAAIDNGQEEAVRGRLVLEVLHLTDLVAKLEQQVEIGRDAPSAFEFSFVPPSVSFRGYGLDVTLFDDKGAVLARASGALDVLERWSQAPRYGFLSDFAPEQEGNVEAKSRSLARYHLNVVQFYDWMWRHYLLLPPEEEFDDAMGRRLSLSTIRAAISAVHARGGAALAYGAVYGAEPEYAEKHPELRLYDEEGKPISLAELFYIMNIAPGSEWTELMVSEFAEAVRALGFDGIHLDQYGFPKSGAHNANGEPVDLALYFPPMINQAKAAVAAEREGAGVIFNAVENWPIETVAPTDQDAVYIEVWPPYVTYNDLRKLIQEGKRLGGGKQVILAAYLSPFADPAEANGIESGDSGQSGSEIGAVDVSGAEAAALFATAIITASGGFHLLLGEQDGVLCDPYYPKYATMRSVFAARMGAYYDFLVRYEELFVGSDVEDWTAAFGDGVDKGGVEDKEDKGEQVTVGGVEAAQEAEPRKIWIIARRKPGYRILHLINMTNQESVEWNSPRTVPESLGGVRVDMAGLPPIERVLFLTPEGSRGTRVLELEWVQHESGVGSVSKIGAKLPVFDVWGVIVCVLAPVLCG